MKNKIGIVGGGQLAQMLIFEAKKMGFWVTVLDPDPLCPGGLIADDHITASLADENAMSKLAEKSDVITFDWEQANAAFLKQLEKNGKIVHPSPVTLEIIKDKLKQKQFLKKHHIPVAPFAPITSHQDVAKIAREFGYPLFLKARFDAYDGKGNALVAKEEDIPKSMEKLKKTHVYAEQYIPFTKEVSVIAARSIKGDIRMFPISENIHKESILRTTIVPARIPKAIQKNALSLAKRTMKILEGAGVFGIEMFVDKKGHVIINEIAPRVHNSGHYTIEGCTTSQFEQHIRAITGFPLGNTNLTAKAVAMVNILGERNGPANLQGLEKALQISDVSVHIYGKQETRMGRKMGHITAIGKNVKGAMSRATRARKMINI